MTWAALLVLILAQEPTESVRALIERLGSDEILVRDEAARELKRIGFKALPALREASAQAKGDTKSFIDRVIDRISAFGAPVQVTLEAADRPLREIAAELRKQTLIPIRLVGAAADAKSTVSAREAVLWKVVEDICRARGDLMYRFIDDAIEIYPSPFRSLPSVDAHGMRFFVDRLICDRINYESGGDKHAGFFRQHVAVLVPRGMRVVRVGFKVDELTDDKGNNFAKEPERGGAFGGPLRIVEPDGFAVLPTSRKFLYPFYIHRLNQPVPADDCAKISRLRGKIEVAVAEGLQYLARVPHPLARPSTDPGEGIPSLGITSWKTQDDRLGLWVKGSWNAVSERDLWRDLTPFLLLSEGNGEWQTPPGHHRRYRLSSNETGRINGRMIFPWPEGSSAASLDLVAPHPVVKYEIPFDFKDIPLR